MSVVSGVESSNFPSRSFLRPSMISHTMPLVSLLWLFSDAVCWSVSFSGSHSSLQCSRAGPHSMLGNGRPAHTSGWRASLRAARSPGLVMESSAWRCPDGSFTKTTLEPGSGLDKPKEGALCMIFLEHVGDAPAGAGYPAGSWLEVQLGEGDTAQDRLIDQCLETMLPGEVCRVDSKVGLRFVLQLRSFEGGRESWELETCEKILRAMRDREKGGQAFREGNIEGAERRYTRGLRLLVCTPGEAEEQKVALLSNLAACDLKKGRFREAEVRCARILDMEANHLKAFYRRAMARAGMSDWQGARADFDRLLKLDPGNKEARQELARVREKEKVAQAQISKALGKMFL